jgi:FixJ family two-component response regulator
MLNAMGYDCERYECPEAFLSDAQVITPAVILLDMRMPKMSGADLHEQLLNLGRKTPVVMISGEASNHEIIKSMKLGVIDFLLKPFDIPNLLEVLNRALAIDAENMQINVEKRKIKEQYDSLTKREKEICDVLISGALSKSIAIDLGITPATIKVHKAQIMKKMTAKNLLELSKLIAIAKAN